MDKELASLKRAQKLGAEKAIRLNKALKQSVIVVKDDEVISIAPDGNETRLGKAVFGRKKITKKEYVIKDGG
ncbi:MAG: hypothetical protein WAU01_13600 [Saprospiraceae bacterium]